MKMRRMDRVMEEKDAIELLRKGEWGVLSTADSKGQPYGVPMNYALENGYIYLHCAAAGGHRLEAISKKAKVCFTVVGNTEVLPEKFSTRYESVIVFGKAALVETDEEKMAALMAFLRKYSADFMDEGVAYIHRDMSKTAIIRVTLDQVTGKRRP